MIVPFQVIALEVRTRNQCRIKRAIENWYQQLKFNITTVK